MTTKVLASLAAATLMSVTLAGPATAQLTTDPLMAQFLATTPLAPPALVSARQHFFGAENVNGKTGRVNPDKVILSWFSVSSLAAAIRGHVVLLDTYIDTREDYPNRVPTTLQELVALQPEFIFIGHGHFDHADTAGYIAAVTGATVVGTPEHCAQARTDATNALGPTATITCVEVVSANSAPGSEVKELTRARADGRRSGRHSRLQRELATMAPDRRPELRWLNDPVDYIRPGLMTFDFKAPYWKTGNAAGRAPETCKR